MDEIIAITGGSIGSDPYGSSTWSGSSRRFISACEKVGLIRKAVGVEVSAAIKYYNALVTYSLDKPKWRTRFYMTPRYRGWLTHALARELDNLSVDDCALLQFGAEYNAFRAGKRDRICMSYNDGNFVVSSRSPYFPNTIDSSSRSSTIAFEKQVCADMTRVFTMSNYLRKSFIEDYGAEPEKVVCIGAGINLDQFPEPCYKDYANPEIVFVGVDFARKGGEYLLTAFQHVKAKIPQAKLNIIGPSKLPCTGTADGVFFHGNLNRLVSTEAKLYDDIMKRSSLFVMPSVYEPFGIAPLEAMAYRIPCVVSDGWALPEIVPHGRCGELVPLKDTAALCDTIFSLLKDPDLLSAYGKNGREHVQANFTWDSVANRLKSSIATL